MRTVYHNYTRYYLTLQIIKLNLYSSLSKQKQYIYMLLLLLLLSHFSYVRLCATPQMAGHQAPPSLGFSKQEHWSGVPLPSLTYIWAFIYIYIYTHTHTHTHIQASLVAQTVNNLPSTKETWVQSLGQEDPPKKEMATHSSVLAWRIPGMGEPGGLPSMGLHRVGHN